MTTRFLGEGRTDVVLMLDDRPAALTAGGFAEEWRLWLQLSNILGARVNSDSATITTWKQSAASKPQLELVPAQGAAQAALPPQWAALLPTATSTEQAFLQALSELDGLPLPDMGLEVGDGIPVSFAWPDIRLIADFELDERDHQDLEAAGWTVVPADAASIAAILLPSR